MARDPSLYQPQLTRWGHAWRFAACLLIGALAWGTVAESQWRDRSVRLWVDPLVGVLAYLLVTQRRRWPLAVAVGTSVLSMVSASQPARPPWLSSRSRLGASCGHW